mmetsp:Transcript_28467/g.45874  ORF Transcript_28467/g.45874 Transcript_28467/m.45874 type:complete len:948 (-) Transcript_28467:2769-5612(-)|eukprot:CAMPEP_0203754740 /NCGR_PEP_ID=MMETSP0098-20131031/8311_1 /ASSEMBLY_ACC=CAM_ASM_000208 /TAXON_ID=96639 /ORGANISM=" , Strain NY0313808BC1" /LENGTH=947 /DNA_ID=CAMNT_0050645911 /DNA_START=347 /DNA_END=3190 /DNA_ORIENTATION=+
MRRRTSYAIGNMSKKGESLRKLVSFGGSTKNMDGPVHENNGPIDEEDKVVNELRQLAIRLQKNGGVDISDKRWGTRVWKSCFTTEDLCAWLEQEFLIDGYMAVQVCYELWLHGLIAHVLHSNKPFARTHQLFFRVAHPYAINLLMAPSSLDRLYTQLRGTQGPKVVDLVQSGTLYYNTFRASQIIDWLCSVHKLNQKERAVQVAQQLMNAGYIYGLKGQTVFTGDSHMILQYKHDHSKNLRMTHSKAGRLCCLLQTKIELAQESEPTVESCLKWIEKLVVDCARPKALYIFGKLVQIERILVLDGNCGQLSSRPPTSTELLYHVGFKNPDGALETCKQELEQTGHVDKISTTTVSQDAIDLTKYDSCSIIQQRNIALMRMLGASSMASSTGVMRAWQIVKRILHIFMIFNLWMLLTSQSSTFEMSQGIEEGITGGREFIHLSSFQQLIEWVRVQQLGKNLDWIGNQYLVLDEPQVMFGYATATACSEENAERSDHALLVRLQKRGELFSTDNVCAVNQNDGLFSAREVVYTKFVELEWNSVNTSFFDKAYSSLDSFISQHSPLDDALVEFVTFQVSLLSYKTRPLSVVNVRAIGRTGPLKNDIHVRIVQMPSENSLTGASTELSLILATCILLLVFDCLLNLIIRRIQYFWDFSSWVTLLKILLSLLGYQMKHFNQVMLFEYMEPTAGGTISLSTFDDLVVHGELSRAYFAMSMFLGTAPVAGHVFGDKYNIFLILRSTLGGVYDEVRVILVGFLCVFSAFALTTYSFMYSYTIEFATPQRSAMTMLGSLFGGSPWETIRSKLSTNPVIASICFFFMATYLLFTIFILVNMLVAILIGSYQIQKRQAERLEDELKRHLHASAGSSDISTLLRVLSERRTEFQKASGRVTTKTNESIIESLTAISEFAMNGEIIVEDLDLLSESQSFELKNKNKNASDQIKVHPSNDS